MDRVSNLEWRGLLHECSDRDAIAKLGPNDSFYVGYDPTAPSLQLGNLVPMIASLHLARSGIKCIQLFGGATGAIGDPSGKRQERQLLSREDIERNVSNHKRLASQIFARAGVEAEFVDNFDWTRGMSVIEFLRDVGKHFTVNYMLAKETVKTRLDGDGLSFTEFSYMLLQSMDFHHLRTTKNCKLQIGGSDQWGNITAGLELIRKKGAGEAYALGIPLLLDSQGKKFGKTADGAIWLDANATSPYRFHQFWLNVEDADAIRYLKIFTFLSQEEIQALAEATAQHPEKREAQKKLADAVCNLVHGEQATTDAKRSAEVLFGGSLEGLSGAQLGEIFKDVPSSTLPRAQIAELKVLDLFVSSGLAKSKGEARRLFQNGGAYFNNERVSNAEASCAELLGPEALSQSTSMIVLRSGKKSYHLIKMAE
jgi:tyrosyl-tRNA synthetase